MSVKLLTEHHLEYVSLNGGCTGSSESTLVKMPHYWKSRVTAHFGSIRIISFITPAQDPCTSDPCLHGSSCSIKFDSYECACPGGLLGRNCETGKQNSTRSSVCVRLVPFLETSFHNVSYHILVASLTLMALFLKQSHQSKTSYNYMI